MTSEVTYIGMDLGAFKTSVMSSNGRRETVPSIVGWTKDIVARTMLGHDVVFGEDVIRHRLAVNAVRPFEKGVLKYLDATDAGMEEEQTEQHRAAAKLLVQHVVSLTRPHPERPVFGVIGAPSRATCENKEVILAAAGDACDAVMIVPEPFAVAYGMNRLNETLVVDIGAGTTDICPMYGAFPQDEDQVTVPLGGDAIDQRLFDLVSAAHAGAELNLNMARDWKERYGFVRDGDEPAVVEVSVTGIPRDIDVTEQLNQACSILLEPVIEGLRQVVSRLDPDFRRSAQHNIILAGGGSQLRGLDRLIENQLQLFGGARVKRVPDSVYAGAGGALKLAMNIPPDQWDALTSERRQRPAA